MRAGLMRRPVGQSLSMVPLADMLTNTIGILLFVLIFVVLSAGGAQAIRRMPIERSTNLDALHVYCQGDRVYLIDLALAKGLAESAKLPKPMTSENFPAWAKRFSGSQVGSQDMTATGDAGFKTRNAGAFTYEEAYAVVDYSPRPDGGQSVTEHSIMNSRLAAAMATSSRDKFIVHFFVRPNGIRAFQTARDYARKAGFQTGWVALGPEDKPRFALVGKGSPTITD